MPCTFKHFPVFLNQILDFVEHPRAEAIIVRQGYFRMQPEFGFVTPLKHVDMGRFSRAAFVRVEQEAQAVDA